MIYFIYPNVDIWEYIVTGIKDKDVELCPLNLSCYKWQLFLRKLLQNQRIPAVLLFGRKMIKQLKKLRDGDTVLVADYSVVCIHRAINAIVDSKVRKCLWIWNPVKRESFDVMNKRFNIIKNMGYELCTFDEGNATRFNMNLYNQFFIMHQDEVLENEIYDFYFIGFEKNRSSEIHQLEKQLTSYRAFFKVVNRNCECIPYSMNMLNVKRSKCVVEILQVGQKGMTLRTLEALSCGKKLMTNNIKIMQSDLYSPENVFVIGRDDFSKIQIFLDGPYKHICSQIIEKYDIATWIDHFRN